jgi:hypothetical protein
MIADGTCPPELLLLADIANDTPPPQKKTQINWGKPGPGTFCDRMHKAIQNWFNIGKDRLDDNKECIKDHAIYACCVGIPCKTFYKYIHPWFQMSRSTLAPLLSDRDKILHSVRQASHLSPLIQATMKADLVCLNCHVALAISHAKAKYYANVCAKIHDMQMNPRLAWEHICLLTKGETAHHSKSTAMAIKLPDSTRASNASENMSVFSPHFHKVYNNHHSTDPSVLEHVPQRRTMWELDDPINWNEFSRAVRKLKNAKAGGLTKVPPEAFKAMQTANQLHIFKYINDFFLGAADYDQWHQSQCVPVPKNGDLSNPNKWWGVMLMDVCSKIFSSVMNKRAFKLLSKHGMKFQFRGTPQLGCQDGLFVLKTMLNMRKNHNLA